MDRFGGCGDYFGHFFGFRVYSSFLRYFSRFRGSVGILVILVVSGYFDHFRGSRGILVILKVFRGILAGLEVPYIDHFSGFRVVLVILEILGVF